MTFENLAQLWRLLPPGNPGSVFYWPYLLSGALLLALLIAWRGRAVFASRGSVLGTASARVDLAFLLLAMPMALLVLWPLADLLRVGLRGDATPLAAVATWPLDLLYTFSLVLAFDLGYFISHYALHRVPLLWCFHRLHHSAERLSPLTSVRSHPVDLLLIVLVSGLTTAATQRLWITFAPASYELLRVAEVNLFLFLFYLGGYHFRHSEIPIDYGRHLNRVLISPRQHQFHHSCDPRHHHRNMGLILAVWDGLAGTLYQPGPNETIRYGLPTGQGGSERGFGSWLLEPAKESWRHSRLQSLLLAGVLLSPLGFL